MKARKRPANTEAAQTAKKPFGISQSQQPPQSDLDALASLTPPVPEDYIPTKELLTLRDRVSNFNYSLLEPNVSNKIYRAIAELAMLFLNKNISPIIKYLRESAENNSFDKKDYCMELANILIHFQSCMENTRLLTEANSNMQQQNNQLGRTARLKITVLSYLELLRSKSKTEYEKNIVNKNASTAFTNVISALEKLQNHAYRCLSTYSTPEEIKKYDNLQKAVPAKAVTSANKPSVRPLQTAPEKPKDASPDVLWPKQSFRLQLQPSNFSSTKHLRLTFLNKKQPDKKTESVSTNASPSPAKL